MQREHFSEASYHVYGFEWDTTRCTRWRVPQHEWHGFVASKVAPTARTLAELCQQKWGWKRRSRLAVHSTWTLVVRNVHSGHWLRQDILRLQFAPSSQHFGSDFHTVSCLPLKWLGELHRECVHVSLVWFPCASVACTGSGCSTSTAARHDCCCNTAATQRGLACVGVATGCPRVATTDICEHCARSAHSSVIYKQL